MNGLVGLNILKLESFITVSVVLGGLNPIWQPSSENKHLPHLNKLHNFPQQNAVEQWEHTLSLPSVLWFFLLLTPKTHLTFPAPDRHGQFAFNPPPCSTNQVTTPVTRAQGSVSAWRKKETSLLPGWRLTNKTLEADRIGHARPNYAVTGDTLTAAAGTLWPERHQFRSEGDRNIYVILEW